MNTLLASFARYRLLAAAVLLAMTTGCRVFSERARVVEEPAAPAVDPQFRAPTEKLRVALPTYRIEPPDILLIDAVKIVPKPPFRIAPLDQLQINAAGTLAGQPITGTYAVEVGGAIDLGPVYGRVAVVGLTLDEATEAVSNQLSRVLRQPQVSVTLAQSGGQQQIAGEKEVAPDGRVNLGTYGSVYVAGMTVDEARQAIEQHLSEKLANPRVAVDVGAFNSKVYYVITQGAGFGQSVVQSVSRFPVTGNETVLDAISNVNGLSQLACKHEVWIARPAPEHYGCDQHLRVNWDEITKRGDTSTNFQVLPGDRIYIGADKFYTADALIAEIVAPFSRILGVTSLGSQTVERVRHPQASFGNPNTSRF